MLQSNNQWSLDDMSALNHNKLANKALAILERYEINEPVVDLLKIAEGEKIGVKEIVLPYDVAGFLNKRDNTIYVNKEDPDWRKMFSVAHELGHYFLEHKNYEAIYRHTKVDQNYAVEEQEANSFAIHLLAPEFMLKKYLIKYGLTTNDYEPMAKIFGVSMSAMQNALSYLN